MWGALLTTALSLLQQNQQKQEAEKLAQEQRKQEAFANVLRVMGGGMPQALSAQSTPQINWAGAVGGLIGAYADEQKQAKADARQDKLDQRSQDQWIEKMNLERDKINADARQWGIARNDKLNELDYERNPDTPKNQLIQQQVKQLKAKLDDAGQPKTQTMTPAQAWGVLKDIQEEGKQPSILEQMIAKQQGLSVPQTPKSDYQVPDSLKMKIEDALGAQPRYVGVAGEEDNPGYEQRVPYLVDEILKRKAGNGTNGVSGGRADSFGIRGL